MAQTEQGTEKELILKQAVCRSAQRIMTDSGIPAGGEGPLTGDDWVAQSLRQREGHMRIMGREATLVS